MKPIIRPFIDYKTWCKGYRNRHVKSKLFRRIIRENSRKSKKTRVAEMPKVSGTPTTLPDENRTDLVSNMRGFISSRLGENNREGGKEENKVNDPPTLGKLVVKLTRLEEYCKVMADEGTREAIHNPSRPLRDLHSGRAAAYSDVINRLYQLIESTKPYKPIGR